MFGIKLKPETKAKIHWRCNRVVNAVKPWVAPIAVFLTACAAWDGYSNSRRNERELRELRNYASAIDHGGGNLYHKLNDRIDALEEKNKELLNKAMDVTEEKEES